jgi:hypothetical protein
MSQYILPSIVNGIAVFVGLFVLWSFVGGMKAAPAQVRATAAATAGVVAIIMTFVVSTAIATGAA